MGANAGRSLSKWTVLHIDNASDVLTQITSINSIGGIALDSPEVNLTAWADAVQGALLGTPSFTTQIGGVFNTADNATLSAINGLNTPLSLDIRVGIRHAWEAGEPHFGLTSTATAGVLLKNYTVNIENGTWQATIVMYTGSTAPAWSTGAAYA